MTALTAPRVSPPDYGINPVPNRLAYPIADNVKIFPGAMIAINASGQAQPATTSTSIIVVGRYEGTNILDNTVSGHAAGAFTVEITQGTFPYANSLSGDAITGANRGAVCYAVDDQTVALTSGSSTRAVAGIIVDVDANGNPYVLQGVVTKAVTAGAPTNPAYVISVSVPSLAAIANSSVPLRLTPGVAGRIIGTAFQTTTPVTTGSKAATLTPKIAGVSVTGGVLSLTSANNATMGTNTPGTAVTAANTFGATDEITVVASSVTAFVEGAGVILIYVG